MRKINNFVTKFSSQNLSEILLIVESRAFVGYYFVFELKSRKLLSSNNFLSIYLKILFRESKHWCSCNKKVETTSGGVVPVGDLRPWGSWDKKLGS